MIRVLIVSPHRLLGQGLHDWLRQQEGLDVVGWETDTDKASKRIGELSPDIIVQDMSDSAKTPLAALMGLLADRPGAKVLGVNLRDNSICIYSSEQHAIDHVREFLEALRGPPAGGVDKKDACGQSPSEVCRP